SSRRPARALAAGLHEATPTRPPGAAQVRLLPLRGWTSGLLRQHVCDAGGAVGSCGSYPAVSGRVGAGPDGGRGPYLHAPSEVWREGSAQALVATRRGPERGLRWKAAVNQRPSLSPSAACCCRQRRCYSRRRFSWSSGLSRAIHSRAVRSWLAVARRLPSGLKATAAIWAVCPRRTTSGLLEAAAHSRAVWSRLAVARRRPSGLKDTAATALSCPRRTASGLPEAVSHSRAVPSLPAVARWPPSGLKTTESTTASCPRRTAGCLPEAASH